MESRDEERKSKRKAKRRRAGSRRKMRKKTEMNKERREIGEYLTTCSLYTRRHELQELLPFSQNSKRNLNVSTVSVAQLSSMKFTSEDCS